MFLLMCTGITHFVDQEMSQLQLTYTYWLMYTSIFWYLRVLPVLHRPEVVDIGVNTIEKNMQQA